MWFDEIMDDCKNALRIAHKNKGIFIPLFVKLGLNILLIILAFVLVVGNIVRIANLSMRGMEDLNIILRQIPLFLVAGVIIYLIYLLGDSLIEVGSINLLKVAANEEKPRFSYFLEGVKSYFLKVLGGKLLILLIFLVLSPIIILLYVLYTAIIGTLSGGWGLIFLGVLIAVYFASWTTAIVVDNLSPTRAIGISFKLGKKYFPGLFVIMLSSTLIGSYISMVFGPFVALLGGWFIGGVILTYFKLMVLLVYNRKKEELL